MQHAFAYLKIRAKSCVHPLYGMLIALLVTACQPDKSTPDPEQANAGSAHEATIESSGADRNPWILDCESAIAAITTDIEALASFPGPFNVDTVLTPLNDIQTRIEDGDSISSLLESVHPDANVRNHAADCTTGYANLATSLKLSRGVYDAVAGTDVENAQQDTRRFHFLTLQDFRLAGVDRDEETRNRIHELNDKITQLGQEFDKNILEDVRYIEVDAGELAGLPEDFLTARPPQKNGKIRLSTRYVDTIPVYTYVHSDEVRRLLRQQDRSRGYPQNEQVLKDLLIARRELASILGFENYADLITNDKMIASGANAMSFIRRIHNLAAPAAESDKKTLLDRLQQIDPKATEVQRWQVDYLEELIRREKYSIDAAQLRQYFTYGKVKQGIFDLVEHLFNLRITPWQTDTWHTSVESYEMHQGDRLIGRFFLDMHPREGKYQHAAAFSYQMGVAGRQIPISALVCNFAGGDDPDEPMEYRQVNTFLHEFGHLLHALLGGHQRWVRISGINTERDFVEAPSQMLEEWIYDTETLQTFATNQRGEPIPQELVENLRAARFFGEGVKTAVQMYYAALSLEFHRLDPQSVNLVDKMLALENRYSPYPHQDQTYFFANLGHLNGYSAMYYTYMWSSVIATDLFSRFEQTGLRNPQVAAEYRDKVLAPGGAKPAASLVEDFLGRPYNFAAFARRLTDRENIRDKQ